MLGLISVLLGVLLGMPKDQKPDQAPSMPCPVKKVATPIPKSTR